MNSVKEVIENPTVSAYTGSLATKACVKKQIEKRFGKEQAERYDPNSNCFTFPKWVSMGFRIKPREQSLRSTTFVEVPEANGKVKKYKKTVHLFFDLQVHKGRYY